MAPQLAAEPARRFGLFAQSILPKLAETTRGCIGPRVVGCNSFLDNDFGRPAGS